MTWKDDEMDERLMSDEAVEDAVLRYLDESPEVASGMTPSRDLWPDIEARIGARVLPLSRESVEVRRMRRRPAWLPMAAAAAFLVASTAGVTYMLTKRFTPTGAATSQVATTQVPTAQIPTTQHTVPVTQPTSAPEQTAPVAAPDAPPQMASAGNVGATKKHSSRTAEVEEKHTAPRVSRAPSTSLASYPVTGSDEARVTYDDEITRLHGVLESRRDQLDPSTVATVERNLHIIDDAIAQARAALIKDPHSRLLNEQLDRTLAKKTQLLRAATLLPSV